MWWWVKNFNYNPRNSRLGHFRQWNAPSPLNSSCKLISEERFSHWPCFESEGFWNSEIAYYYYFTQENAKDRKKNSLQRVPNRFSGIRDIPSLKLGIRDFIAKSGRDSGLKVCAGGGMPKIALGITGLKNPIGDPLYSSLEINRFINSA